MQIGLGTSITVTRGGVGISVSIGSGFAITGGTLTATVSGLVGGETVTYQWTDDGGNISGATSSTYAATIGTDSVADASRMRCVATVDGTPYTSNSRILAYAAGTAPAIADGQAFTVGTAVNIDASASGANLTFTYALSGAPAGLTINASTGAITGDPTTVETGTTTITPTDQYGRTYPDTFTYGVTAANTVPAITGVPTISGTETEDETLTATAASFTGNPTPSRTWQWERTGVAISGATSATYTLVTADVGETITVVQTETNSEGSDTAESTATGTIAAAATAPAQMAAPAVTSAGETSISVDRAAAPSDGGSAITSYDLRWSTDEATWTTVTGIADPETVASLTASTLYYAQTRAVNAVGAGAWSASGSATTDAVAGGVDDPTTIMGANSLAWLDPQDTATMFNTVTGTGAITTDGDLVGRIVDQEGSVNFDATGNTASRPIYRTADGGYLEGAVANDTILRGSISNSGTGYLAMRLRIRDIPPSTTEQFCVVHAVTGTSWFFGSNDQALEVRRFGGSPAVSDVAGTTVVGSLSNGVWLTIELIFETNRRRLTVNGVSVENTDTYATPSTTFATLLGAPGGGGGDFDLGRWAFAGSVPTTQQRIDMRAWLEA